MVEAKRDSGIRKAQLSAHRRRGAAQIVRRERRDTEPLADAHGLGNHLALDLFLGAAQGTGHGVTGQRRIAEAAREGIFVVAHRLLDDLQRKIGERLVDHAPLLDPPRRDIDARGAVVRIQFISNSLLQRSSTSCIRRCRVEVDQAVLAGDLSLIYVNLLGSERRTVPRGQVLGR